MDDKGLQTIKRIVSKMVYNKKKQAAQGIGTLIIFIALILVAAVAAAVLINTVGNLQGKAETTGVEIQQRIGTGFSVVDVVANDTSDSSIDLTDTIQVSVQLAPGSDPVRFEDITLTLITQGGLYSYTNASTPSATEFAPVQVKGDISDGYLNRDDVAGLRFLSGAVIGEQEGFIIRIFPGVGSPQPIDLVTPPSMVETYTVLK